MFLYICTVTCATGWVTFTLYFLFIFLEKYIFHPEETPLSEVLQQLLMLAFPVPSLLCPWLRKTPAFATVPFLDPWIRLQQPKEFWLFVLATYTWVCYWLFIQQTQLLEASYFHWMPHLPTFQICFKGIRELTNPFQKCWMKVFIGKLNRFSFSSHSWQAPTAPCPCDGRR